MCVVALSWAASGSFWPAWVETLALAPVLEFSLLTLACFKVAVKEMPVVTGVSSLELWVKETEHFERKFSGHCTQHS